MCAHENVTVCVPHHMQAVVTLLNSIPNVDGGLTLSSHRCIHNLHTVQRQTLQFPLREFRPFCGQNQLSAFWITLAVYYRFCLWVLLFSLCHRNWFYLSHSLTAEKKIIIKKKRNGSCQCWRLSEWIAKNKTPAYNRGLSSAQIKCLCYHTAAQLF